MLYRIFLEPVPQTVHSILQLRSEPLGSKMSVRRGFGYIQETGSSKTYLRYPQTTSILVEVTEAKFSKINILVIPICFR